MCTNCEQLVCKICTMFFKLCPIILTNLTNAYIILAKACEIYLRELNHLEECENEKIFGMFYGIDHGSFVRLSVGLL